MTGACPDLLAALKLRMRDLELDAVEVKARISELGEMITMLEHPQRKRGRPPGPRAVFTPRRVTPSDPPPVQHVPGSIFRPDTDDDELPLQSNAPGA
jgi:hypothetical protein